MAGINTSDFFKKPRNQSEIKSEILTKYFKTWASIMLIALKGRFNIDRLLYIDLFCGKGYYDNGDPSTPIKILDSIISNDVFNNKIRTFFNDSKAPIVEEFKENIENLQYYEDLKYKPVILNQETNRELLYELLNSTSKQCPSLTFIDPFGYKGVSASLCKLAVKKLGLRSFSTVQFK